MAQVSSRASARKSAHRKARKKARIAASASPLNENELVAEAAACAASADEDLFADGRTPVLATPWAVPGCEDDLVPVLLPDADGLERTIYEGCLYSYDFAQFLEQTAGLLEDRREGECPPCELAFCGGCFAAQSRSEFAACLKKAKDFLDQGLISGWRCSTAPDSLGADQVRAMAAAGCRCVELCVDTLSPQVRRMCQRGHADRVVKKAIKLVRDAGLVCGVRLVPGLPESAPEDFVPEVRALLSFGARFFTIYPCLVTQYSSLERLYRSGLYRPWPTDTTIAVLAQAVREAHQAGCPVQRIGLPNMEEKVVLAGPGDPGLQDKVHAQALLGFLREQAERFGTLLELSLPVAVRRHLHGLAGEDKKELAQMGVVEDHIHWLEDDGTARTHQIVLWRCQGQE